jgi:hypothetical protein
LPPIPGIAYVGFVDPSGGSADAFTLAIAHRNPSGAPVLDLVREARPPFWPEAVTADFSRELKRYNLTGVTGDSYAGEWVAEAFRKQGIVYTPAELTRSELYLEALPLVNSGACELLDHARLLAQLSGLERRVGRSGRDAIDHRTGHFDDIANAACGALVHAVRSMALAMLPDTFCRCNCAASIESFSAESCYIFGGGFKPPADVCCSNCQGHQYVRSAREALKARTGEHMDLVTFYRERLDWKAHPFVEKVRHAAWMAVDHGL